MPNGILSGSRLLTNSTPDDRLQTITTSGKVSDTAISFSVSRTANTVLAGPNGSAGAATFRALVGADVPVASGSTQGTVIVGSNITLTSGTISLVSGNITGALGFTPVNKAGDTMTGALTLSADPTAALHAATKQYVDAVKTGLDFKDSVRAIATSNITLSGTQTIDGVALVAGNRVLVAGQTTASANGIYVVAAGAWTRATDADTSTEVTSGMFAFVEQGTAYAGTGWVLSTANPITLGTTSLTFVQFSRAGTYTFGNGLSTSGNAVSVLADPSGTPTITVGAGGISVASASLAVSNLQASAYASANTSSTLVYRDANGRAQFVDPSAAQDAATKNYVDSATGINGTIVQNETPTGTINGVNASFTLANTPITGSVKLYLGGLRLSPTTHYTVSGATITMVSGFEPMTGETFLADYRR